MHVCCLNFNKVSVSVYWMHIVMYTGLACYMILSSSPPKFTGFSVKFKKKTFGRQCHRTQTGKELRGTKFPYPHRIRASLTLKCMAWLLPMFPWRRWRVDKATDSSASAVTNRGMCCNKAAARRWTSAAKCAGIACQSVGRCTSGLCRGPRKRSDERTELLVRSPAAVVQHVCCLSLTKTQPGVKTACQCR